MRKGFNTPTSEQNKSKDEKSGWKTRDKIACRPFAH